VGLRSIYIMAEWFLEQQSVFCSVLADDRKSWHLMPKDSDISVLETVRDVLSLLNDFTDALSGEKQVTISLCSASSLENIWSPGSCGQ